MKTLQQRIAHYDARMQSSLIDPVLTARNAAAVANFTTYAVDFYPKQQALRAILVATATPTSDYAAYEAFHGKLYHLSKTTSGLGLVTVATVLIAYWKAPARLGAGAEATLKLIAGTIYAIVIP